MTDITQMTDEQLLAELEKRKLQRTPAAMKEKAVAEGITLTSKIKTTVHVTDSDLEYFVRSLCGKCLEFVATQECGNDSSHEFDVGGHPEWFTEVDRQQADDFLFGERKYPHDYGIGNILDRLCELELIPKGEYIVSVSW